MSESDFFLECLDKECPVLEYRTSPGARHCPVCRGSGGSRSKEFDPEQHFRKPGEAYMCTRTACDVIVFMVTEGGSKSCPKCTSPPRGKSMSDVMAEWNQERAIGEPINPLRVLSKTIHTVMSAANKEALDGRKLRISVDSHGHKWTVEFE